MAETVKTTINGRDYTLTLCGARQANRVALRITGLLGKALGPLLTSGSAGIAEAMSTIQLSRNEADLDYLIDVFAERTEIVLATIVTKTTKKAVPVLLKDTFDQHFSGGRLIEQWIWLAWCIQENFADFFVEARRDKGLQALREFAPDLFKSESPTDAIGSSGGS